MPKKIFNLLKSIFYLFKYLFEQIEQHWCLFLSFFWAQKSPSMVPFFKRCIMLSKTCNNIPKLFLLFFDSICTRVEKILRKWTKKMSKNRIDETFLRKNARP
jgi:hypothetical protein